MSRAKTTYISRERVKACLKKRVLTQTKLCEEQGYNEQSFNRALRKGSISEKRFDAICRILNVEPAYLNGTLRDFEEDEELPDYEFLNRMRISGYDLIKDLCRKFNFNPDQLTQDDLSELFFRFHTAFIDFMRESGY